MSKSDQRLLWLIIIIFLIIITKGKALIVLLSITLFFIIGYGIVFLGIVIYILILALPGYFWNLFLEIDD